MSRGRTLDIEESEALQDSQPPRPGAMVLFSEAPLVGDGLYEARPEISIGRSADCTILLEDPGMSRSHATLLHDEDGFSLRDLGSRNGTFLNGRRLQAPRAVAEGDLIRCGQTLLKVMKDISGLDGWRRWGLEGPLIGGSAIRRLLGEIAAFASDDLEVLVTGESGTGKELVAREIHACSGRRGPFIAVNCAAIPHALFESELFGVCKGAYTDASVDRQGLFQSASRGTLFLDEVGEIPSALQAKLLRAVEQKEVRPLGASQSVQVDVRVIAATNRDLQQDVHRGAFRPDLFHRLRGFLVQIPPLRERYEDIPLFIEKLQMKEGSSLAFSTLFVERLLLHSWPGNVRELDRVLRESYARATSERASRVQLKHLRQELLEASSESEEEERFLAVKEALTKAKGNVSRAASSLSMHRAKIYAMLRERGINPEDFR